MTTNKELMAKARDQLSDKWKVVIGTSFVYVLFSSTGGEAPVLSLILGGALQLGFSVFLLNIVRGKKYEFGQLFDGFKRFADALETYLFMTLFVFLWTLLLIVPGIIAAIAYSQTFFIMVDDKKIKGRDALQKSKQMMDGHKAKYFWLCLRFTGWFILCILTLGIGLLWLIPYMSVSFANFYEDIKKTK